jgi:hypothetical protein
MTHPGVGPLTPIRRHPNRFRQRLPVPGMRAVPLANPACVPAGNSNVRPNDGGWNTGEQWLDSLREHFACKPVWLFRYLPFRACLCVPSPRSHMFGARFRAARRYSSKSGDISTAFSPSTAQFAQWFRSGLIVFPQPLQTCSKRLALKPVQNECLDPAQPANFHQVASERVPVGHIQVQEANRTNKAQAPIVQHASSVFTNEIWLCQPVSISSLLGRRRSLRLLLPGLWGSTSIGISIPEILWNTSIMSARTTAVPEQTLYTSDALPLSSDMQ